MPIYLRNGVWWLDIATPDGGRIRRSARTRDERQAQELHDQIKADSWRKAQLGERPRYRWEQAVERYLSEIQGRPSYYDTVLVLRWLHPHLSGTHLDKIGLDLIERIRKAKAAEGVKPRTVNAVLQTIRGILRRAHRDWEWIDRVPAVRLAAEPKRRIRWLTDDEEAQLLAALPEHLAEMARFSLATGLRMSNVTGLQWSQVDLEARRAWVHADEAKAGQAIPVPLNAAAVLVLRRQAGKHSTHCFTFKGEPINAPNGRAWRHALERAGIENFRWHDMRHTWATRLMQAGTPAHVLMEMAGWSDPAMVRKYAHLAPDHLQEFADRLCRPRPVNGTKSAHQDSNKEKAAPASTGTA